MTTTTTPTTPRSTVWRGYADKSAFAWAESKNFFSGPIPIEKVRDELFGWTAVTGQVTATALTSEGVLHHESTEHKAVMHSDTGRILGIHGSGYQVHQYPEWLLGTVGNILDADLAIAGAGLFKYGAVAFVQIEMADTLDVAGMQYRPYLTAATSHDGSLSTTFTTGVTVVCCSNSLSAALKSDQRYKVRHTARSMTKISDARAALGIVHQVADDFADQVDALVNQKISDDTWARFVTAFTDNGSGSKRSESLAQTKAGELYRMYNHDERVTPWRGTALGVVQAVNTWMHHEQTVRGATRAERNMQNMVLGKNGAVDQKVLDLLALV